MSRVKKWVPRRDQTVNAEPFMNRGAMHSRPLAFHPVALVLARTKDGCESAECISDMYNTAPTSTSALCLLEIYRPPRC